MPQGRGGAVRNIILAAFYQRKAKRFVPLTNDELFIRTGCRLKSFDVRQLVYEGLLNVESLWKLANSEYIAYLTPKGEAAVREMLDTQTMPGDVPIKVQIPFRDAAKIKNARMRERMGGINPSPRRMAVTREMDQIRVALDQPMTQSEIVQKTGLPETLVNGSIARMQLCGMIQKDSLRRVAGSGAVVVWARCHEPQD